MKTLSCRHSHFIFERSMEAKYERLRKLAESDIDTFEKGVLDLEREDLVRLVGVLQISMQEERDRFYRLNRQYRNSFDSDVKNNLTDELCLSQGQMAQLCAKNMKCYEQKSSISNGSAAEYPHHIQLQDRKSLSALYKEKQLIREIGVSSNGTDGIVDKEIFNGEPTEGGKTYISKVDVNGNDSLSANSNDTIREAFQTVLTDILGREVDIKKPTATASSVQERLNSSKVKTGNRNSYTAGLTTNSTVHSNNSHLLYPVKPQQTAAAKPNEYELQESKRRILEQVRRQAKGQGKENFAKSRSIDVQSSNNYSPYTNGSALLNLSSDKKPLRSILKKKSMSTSEPNLNGDSTSPTQPRVDSVAAVAAQLENIREMVAQSSIQLRRPSAEPDNRKTVSSLKPAAVNTGGSGSNGIRTPVDETGGRSDLPDVVNDPNKRTPPAAASNRQSSPETVIMPSSGGRKINPQSENGHGLFYFNNEHDDHREWDPRILLEDLYDVDYTPRKEAKKRKFVNMEGHLEHLPLGLKVAVVDKLWRTHYFKTKDGRLLWFENPDTDIIPFGDILLAGTELDIDKNESTLLIHGGKEGTLLKLKCPSHLLDKWRQAILSHNSATVEETFVKPVYPPIRSPSDSVCVIELGSCSIRAGVLTTEPSLPLLFFPAIATNMQNGDVVIGREALSPDVRHNGTFVQPIKPTNLSSTNRYSVDLNAVRHTFKKIFDDLNISPASHDIMLSVPQNAPVNMIEDLMKILLNEFHVRGVAVAKQPYLILYSYDVTTGVVVDIGDHLNIVPVIDGYIVQNAIVSLPYGGFKIADMLRSHLAERNPDVYSYMSPVERFILRYVMEQSCYVAEDFDEEVEKYEKSPDEIDTVVKMSRFDIRSEAFNEFQIDSTRFTCTEGLFKPKRWGLDVDGIQKLIYNAIQSAPMDSRRLLYKNIYLAGGASLLPGLPQRLESEITQLAPSSVQVRVFTSPWRYHAAYIGAQILAGSSRFEQTLITAPKLNTFIRQLHSANF